MHYLLFYEFVPDYLERRVALREVHLKLGWESSERGELVLGGAVGDPIDSAVLVFTCDDASVAEEFARNDNYVTEGLVTRWWVKPWHTVIGEDASNPIKID
jgi:uncharacterized protein YciI